MLDTQNRRTSQVAVGIVAVTKSQAVYTLVAFIVCRTVVEESANTTTLDRELVLMKLIAHLKCTHSAAMGVNDKSQSVKLAHGVDTRGADLALSILRIPYLEVAASSLGPTGPELEFGFPLLLRHAALAVRL